MEKESGYGYCLQCEKKPSSKISLSRCSRCKVALYCSKTCQAEHWKLEHKSVCQPASGPTDVFQKEYSLRDVIHLFRGGIHFLAEKQDTLLAVLDEVDEARVGRGVVFLEYFSPTRFFQAFVVMYNTGQWVVDRTRFIEAANVKMNTQLEDSVSLKELVNGQKVGEQHVLFVRIWNHKGTRTALDGVLFISNAHPESFQCTGYVIGLVSCSSDGPDDPDDVEESE